LTSTAPDILRKIVAHKREELREIAVDSECADQSVASRRDFRAALTRDVPAVIAEIKKASPSKGLLCGNFDPPAIARSYRLGGAACLSVLTDQRFFQGSLSDLQAARAAVDIPVLRKDFTIDERHVIEAAAHGADAILLIVAILTEREIRDLRELASQYSMASLVEVHDDAELQVAIAAGADIVGVNNRNLRTFEVTLETSLRLAERIPSNVVRVAESGIHAAADICQLMDAGYQAFLVGEHLMKSQDPAEAVRNLRGPA
jgi:indole-3-glycerol phosphate synthase